MSKSSTASAKPLSTKSAWAKGPPQYSSAPSPRSQSPALPNVPSHVQPSHSRRPSQLGQGIPIKDGVSITRSNVDALKQGSSVTFGTINDASAPISSSPVPAPAMKSESVKSFGSVPANGAVNGHATSASISAGVSSNGSSKPSSSSASTSTAASSTTSTALPIKHVSKMDIARLFQGSGSSSTPPAPSTSDTQSPSIRSSNLPPQPSHQPPPSQPHQGQSSQPGQPSQLNTHPYPPPFVPGALRNQQNAGPGGPGGPRSPSYNRNMPNGNSPRPSAGPNAPSGPPSLPPAMSSPRLQAHPHPGQPSPMGPPPVQGWSPYPYYNPYDPYAYMYMPHAQQMPPPPNTLGPPHGGMPMSPRTGPMPLQSPAPGTPTPSHAIPAHTPHPPHPPPISHTMSNSVSSVSSTPSTPSTATTPLSGRLSTTAASFVPGRSSKVSIRAPDGAEIKIENWKKGSPGPGASSPASATPPSSFNSPGNRKSIRLESEDARKKRLAEEEEKQKKAKEAEQAKRDAEEKAKKEKERKEKEEKDRLEKAEQEKRKKEEEAKEAERLREEEEKARKVKEEEEQKRKEEEEKERLRLEEEERLRKQKEAEAEQERKRKAEEEERERLKKEQEEKERLQREAEEKAKADEKVEAATIPSDVKPSTPVEEPEEGEVIEEKSELPPLNGLPRLREKEGLRIDTIGATDGLRRRPGPLDLSGTKSASIASPLPSALATARRIEDLGRVQYPEGIKSPSTELNMNAKDSKFRYDRDFLLQFMKVCTEKPDMLPPLDAIGLQPSEQTSYSMTRGGSGRHRQSSGAPPAARQASTGLNFNPIQNFGKAGPANAFNMGQFTAPSAGKMSSEDRFAISNRSASGPAGMVFGRPPPMTRTASQGGPGPMNSKRTRSKRGEDRATNKANTGSQHGHGSGFNSGALAQSALGMEPVVPLQRTPGRWDRKSLAVEPDSPELVDRKVKALLNKLTMEKFDSISDQIIEWANKSEKEKDGRTLIQVIRLVFEKATDEATWSEMYARLCRKMMEKISPQVQDDGIKNADGKPIAGGQLFRKYLLNRCQEDFERGWVAKEATAAAAKSKAAQDSAVKAASEKAKQDDASAEEVALYSEEYYAAQKAKRQGLGLIKFIGELFKLQMLTERIMHECVKKLLGNVDNPEEEEIESLCKLLTTVGQSLDTVKARAHMDVYFSRMKDLIKSPNVSSRMQFMLQDIIELRERKWVSRNLVAAPATIAQIHEAAAKEKALAERESLQKSQLSMSRGGSRRGGERNELTGPDGWTTRPPTKAGDLSQFGKISKAAPMTFGPGSVFAGKKGAVDKKEAISRTSSSSNMFSMLSGNTEAAISETAASKSSRPPSRKASVDLSQSGAPEIRERRRLNLLPRTKPLEESVATPAQEEESSDSEEVEGPSMSEADAKKKIEEDLKEFFGVRNLDEAEVYFSGLPSTYHPQLVDKLVSRAVESKEADARLVGDFFARVASKDLCSAASFEEGFLGIAEFLEDIAIDAPKAWDLMAIMVKGAALDDEAHGRVAAKTTDSAKLLALLS